MACKKTKLTPLKRRIVDLLAEMPGRQMSYYSLGHMLWPQSLYPNAGKRSVQGGPPGWAMPLGRALREMEAADIVVRLTPANRLHHGDVVLARDPEDFECEGV